MALDRYFQIVSNILDRHWAIVLDRKPKLVEIIEEIAHLF